MKIYFSVCNDGLESDDKEENENGRPMIINYV